MPRIDDLSEAEFMKLQAEYGEQPPDSVRSARWKTCGIFSWRWWLGMLCRM